MSSRLLLSRGLSRLALFQLSRQCTLRYLFAVLILQISLLIASQAAHAATVYSDGDDATIGDWLVFDNVPAGATVSSIYNAKLQSDVVELSGRRGANGYQLGNLNSSSGWNNSSEFFASWKMAASEYYLVIFYIDTTLGLRRLKYTHHDDSNLLSSNKRDIHHGLGWHTRDGKWRTFSRDLQADIDAAESGNQILAVNGLRIRGSLLLDDLLLADNLAPTIQLEPYAEVVQVGTALTLNGSGSFDADGDIVSYSWLDSQGNEVCSDALCQVDTDTLGEHSYLFRVIDNSGLSNALPITYTVAGSALATVYEDAEDGTIDGWLNSGTNRDQASIANEFDAQIGSRVIQLQTAAELNTFVLGHYKYSKGWNNRDQSIAEWQMKTDSGFRVTFYLETTNGPRELRYFHTATDAYTGTEQLGRVIKFGLGQQARDGNWQTHQRDLQQDLAEFQPGNSVIAVHGLAFRGSASLDNITLLQQPSDPDPSPVAAFTATPGTGSESLRVQLDASSSSDNDGIVSYAWDFGNGNTAQGVQTIAQYTTAGQKTIALTVTDTAGQTDTLSQTIELSDDDPQTPPIAAFTYEPVDANQPQTIRFDANNSSATEPAQIVQYNWDFGDANSASGAVVTHTYQPGQYDVTLTVVDSNQLQASSTVTITVDEPDTADVTAAAAARLLTQASFGPTTAAIQEVQSMGIAAWIDNQLQLLGPAHLDYVYQYANNGSDRYTRHDIWWLDAVNGSDQLRQRVAFALSQIFVISDEGYALGNSQYGVTRYYDQLRENALGSFRKLLKDVSVSPIMGMYLNMLQNSKADEASKTVPDENYAREVMQLFTIGPHMLNADGTTQMNNGLPMPSFTQTDVEELARVFTGWNYKDATNWHALLGNGENVVDPMEPFPGYHDTGSKTVFGNVFPAGQSAEEDLDMALDMLVNHSNTGPFIAKQLIQKLVTSNPSPAYVARIATVFNDNGAGERGDLGAVVRALLLDAEAREGHLQSVNFGKLREPLLRISHMWRAFKIRPGYQSNNGEFNTNSPHTQGLAGITGQAPLRARSVFNFFSPDYSPLGPVRNAGLVAPEAELYIDNLITTTTTRINTQVQRFYNSTPFEFDLSQSTLDFSVEIALAEDPSALLDHLNILLLSGALSDGLRGVLLEHMAGYSDDPEGRSIRVRDSVSLIMASPEYLVQR